MGAAQQQRAEGELQLIEQPLLLQRGGPPIAQVCTGATGSGHFEVLQYANEHGFPLRAGTNAAVAGRAEVLQYLCDHGCPRPFTCSFYGCGFAGKSSSDLQVRTAWRLPAARALADGRAARAVPPPAVRAPPPPTRSFRELRPADSWRARVESCLLRRC
jgi:hypothetical protein